MIEADPLTIATIANDTAQIVLQAGPPTDLPAQVPDFVSSILETVRSSAGEGGLGEIISGLTPGGSEAAEGTGKAAEGAQKAAGAGIENTFN
ncbi:hypothetical protein [Halodesulfurarchaeum sp.]|uniref:hypothetical protein n=1 Tax=Halodesulfurarchaeum sp. TaxID=1980530 RepID=UPI002FC3B684